MVNLKEVDSYIVEFVRINPGRMAHGIIPHIAARFGLKTKTVSERLKTLHQDGKVMIKDGRFYPANPDFTPVTLDVTTVTEELINKDESTVTHVTEKDTSVTTQDVTPMTPLEPSTKFLLVYDMKADIEDSERRAIYRRLKRAYHQILKEGRYALRIQMSVWEIESREDAYRLASCLPSDKTRIKIYRIVGEES
jgi:hypothetical protein